MIDRYHFCSDEQSEGQSKVDKLDSELSAVFAQS